MRERTKRLTSDGEVSGEGLGPEENTSLSYESRKGTKESDGQLRFPRFDPVPSSISGRTSHGEEVAGSESDPLEQIESRRGLEDEHGTAGRAKKEGKVSRTNAEIREKLQLPSRFDDSGSHIACWRTRPTMTVFLER